MAGVCNNGGESNLTNSTALTMNNANRVTSERGSAAFNGAMNYAMSNMNMGDMSGMNMTDMNMPNMLSNSEVYTGNASRKASNNGFISINSQPYNIGAPGNMMNMNNMPGMNMGGMAANDPSMYQYADGSMMAHAGSVIGGLQSGNFDPNYLGFSAVPPKMNGNGSTTYSGEIIAGANVTREAARRVNEKDPNLKFTNQNEFFRQVAEQLTNFNDRNENGVKQALIADGLNPATMKNNDAIHSPKPVMVDATNFQNGDAKIKINMHQGTTNKDRQLIVQDQRTGSFFSLTGTDQNNDQGHMNGLSTMVKLPPYVTNPEQAKNFVANNIQFDKSASKYLLDNDLKSIAMGA